MTLRIKQGIGALFSHFDWTALVKHIKPSHQWLDREVGRVAITRAATSWTRAKRRAWHVLSPPTFDFTT
ncbi:unnamed protein product [Zymoseptoria tritici ST99CH_3D7]|uniref:Uncharacterized protein n=1 Tax=Zymoseptoria tritici (strain ST99CH_3D7) TaxID=1276538 RepID=A0A1X7RV54_ZYMT9|nr:unnamed protein product [Zymoseptoria tritici ST99CH_3D7]